MPFNIMPWLIGAGIGSNVLGAVMGSRAQGQANDRTAQSQDRLYDLAETEQARRDQLTQAILPLIGKNLGSANIAQLGQTFGQLGRPNAPQAAPQPQQQGQGFNAGDAFKIGAGGAAGMFGASQASRAGGMLGNIAGPLSMAPGALNAVNMARQPAVMGGQQLTPEQERELAQEWRQSGGNIPYIQWLRQRYSGGNI